MTGGASRNQTGESPESNRALSGIKPGDPRNQTGESPESNRRSFFRIFIKKTRPVSSLVKTD